MSVVGYILRRGCSGAWTSRRLFGIGAFIQSRNSLPCVTWSSVLSLPPFPTHRIPHEFSRWGQKSKQSRSDHIVGHHSEDPDSELPTPLSSFRFVGDTSPTLHPEIYPETHIQSQTCQICRVSVSHQD